MLLVYPIVFFSLGVIAVVLFYGGVFLPVWVSVAAFVIVSLYLKRQFKRKKVGALLLLLWLVYALPFIHIVPYLWFDFANEDPLILWGLAVNPYMVDKQTVMLTGMIGAVGGLGIALGASLSFKRINYGERQVKAQNSRSLPTPVWLVWVVAGVALSWLSAPQDTIFTAQYTDSVSMLDDANFSSAWMVSYVILIFALCDAILDVNASRKLFKQQVILWAIVFVVVYLQLLRGDRESLPFVFGVLLIYFYWAAPLTQAGRADLPWLKISISGFALLATAMIVGSLRSALVDVSDVSGLVSVFLDLQGSGVIGFDSLLHGTWSAVLLTPLSVAGDYIRGLLTMHYGQTYLDLLLSAPPGFVADAIGYERPINGFHGPAWEMRYGIGGTHASVVPFMNFGMIGVFLVAVFWAYVFSRYENGALRQLKVESLSLLGAVAMASPHWLWYGEKNILNALIIWFFLGLLYRVSLLASSRVITRVGAKPV